MINKNDLMTRITIDLILQIKKSNYFKTLMIKYITNKTVTLPLILCVKSPM